MAAAVVVATWVAVAAAIWAASVAAAIWAALAVAATSAAWVLGTLAMAVSRVAELAARALIIFRRCTAMPRILLRRQAMQRTAKRMRGAAIMTMIAVIIAASSSAPAIAASILINRTATPAGPMSTTSTVATIPIGMTDG